MASLPVAFGDVRSDVILYSVSESIHIIHLLLLLLLMMMMMMMMMMMILTLDIMDMVLPHVGIITYTCLEANNCKFFYGQVSFMICTHNTATDDDDDDDDDEYKK